MQSAIRLPRITVHWRQASSTKQAGLREGLGEQRTLPKPGRRGNQREPPGRAVVSRPAAEFSSHRGL